MVLFSVLLLFSSCKHSAKNTPIGDEIINKLPKTDQSFDWLLGKWKRINEEAGRSTYEFWERPHDEEYTGFGFTLQGGDTIWQEQIRLRKEEDNWVLYIKAPADPEPAVFRMTLKDENGFTCENPEMEFPKKIKYWKSKHGIKAAVSNDELEIPFEFARLN